MRTKKSSLETRKYIRKVKDKNSLLAFNGKRLQPGKRGGRNGVPLKEKLPKSLTDWRTNGLTFLSFKKDQRQYSAKLAEQASLGQWRINYMEHVHAEQRKTHQEHQGLYSAKLTKQHQLVSEMFVYIAWPKFYPYNYVYYKWTWQSWSLTRKSHPARLSYTFTLTSFQHAEEAAWPSG